MSQQKFPMEVARGNVARGAALLDQKLPGWYRDIHPAELRMDDACQCVLGQIGQRTINLDRLGEWERSQTARRGWSPYNWILRRLGSGRHEVSEFRHGFNVYGRSAVRPTYEDLKQAWTEEVERRMVAEAKV